MAVTLTIAEIRKMPRAELLREAEARRLHLAKITIDVRMGRDKDTSKLRKERRALARMLTVLHDSRGAAPLKKVGKTPTLPISSRTRKNAAAV